MPDNTVKNAVNSKTNVSQKNTLHRTAVTGLGFSTSPRPEKRAGFSTVGLNVKVSVRGR